MPFGDNKNGTTALPQLNIGIHPILEAIVKNMFIAIRNRNWDLNSPFWTQNFAPTYSYDGLQGGYGVYGPVGLSEHIQVLKTWAEDYPDYYLQLTDIWTYVTEFGDVSTYCNYDTLNSPPGIVKEVAAMVKWMQIDGRWMILEIQTMAGMG